ncbi:hypothetical protein Goshw_015791, partial [Gossypium schwendimanii]|nr:hypothetical protein [Gossypium schwendimanii]
VSVLAFDTSPPPRFHCEWWSEPHRIGLFGSFSHVLGGITRQLVGSTLLAKEEDRPHLEKGEFYTRDLIGMRVILKLDKASKPLELLELELELGSIITESSSSFFKLNSSSLMLISYDSFRVLEYCEKYVKTEDVVGVEEVKSSDKKLSEDEYAASEEEETTGKIDL